MSSVAKTGSLPSFVKANDEIKTQRPSREEAEAAVRTLIRWAGDDPEREGLVGTPDRVVRSYEEFFAGYDEDPVGMLERTFEETDGYDEMVVLRDIRLESHWLRLSVGLEDWRDLQDDLSQALEKAA